MLLGQTTGVSDEKLTFQEHLKLAEQGNAESQNFVGNYYYANKDFTTAVEFYQKAAKQGLVKAICNLGICFKHGLGVTRDYTKAVEYFNQAAEQGFSRAQCELAICYADGSGVPQEFLKAVVFYMRAIDQGDARAQVGLGHLYFKGHGVLKDHAKAVELFTLAAKQGDAAGQYNLGVIYESGCCSGIQKDPVQAMFWHHKAAVQDYQPAIESLMKLQQQDYFQIKIPQIAESKATPPPTVDPILFAQMVSEIQANKETAQAALKKVKDMQKTIGQLNAQVHSLQKKVGILEKAKDQKKGSSDAHAGFWSSLPSGQANDGPEATQPKTDQRLWR